MRRVLQLATVQRAVRARICSECPARTPGDDRTARPRACEAACPHFSSLPRLWGLAVRIDPMVGRFGRAMARAVCEAEWSAASPPDREVSPRGRQFANALRDLSGN